MQQTGWNQSTMKTLLIHNDINSAHHSNTKFIQEDTLTKRTPTQKRDKNNLNKNKTKESFYHMSKTTFPPSIIIKCKSRFFVKTTPDRRNFFIRIWWNVINPVFCNLE